MGQGRFLEVPPSIAILRDAKTDTVTCCCGLHKPYTNRSRVVVYYFLHGVGMTNLDLSFEIISDSTSEVTYSGGCTSGGSSGCCTAICSGGCKGRLDQASQAAWDQYLEINAGVLQY